MFELKYFTKIAAYEEAEKAATDPQPLPPWEPPDPATLPDDSVGRTIRYGHDLIANTAALIGPDAADPARRYAGNIQVSLRTIRRGPARRTSFDSSSREPDRSGCSLSQHPRVGLDVDRKLRACPRADASNRLGAARVSR